jgi:WD40 repeat protein
MHLHPLCAAPRDALRRKVVGLAMVAGLAGCVADEAGLRHLSGHEADAGEVMTPDAAPAPDGDDQGVPDLAPSLDGEPAESDAPGLPGPGEACQEGGPACATGVCAEWRCCDSPCDGVCMACTEARTGLPDGRCGPVIAGTDPDGECWDGHPASCRTTGVCNGAGACRNYPDGTVCESRACDRAGDPFCTYACRAGRCDTDAPLPPPCGAGGLGLSASLRLAPAADGQPFVRCGTLGSEAARWQVTISPDGRRLAARTGAGTVRLIATDSWREVAQLASPLGRIDAVAFSPDGARLVTLAGEMGTTTVWRSEDGRLERTFAGPPRGIRLGASSSLPGLAFSPDGGRIATGLRTVIDLATGTTIDWGGQTLTRALEVNPQRVADSSPGLGIRFVSDGTLFVEAPHAGGGNSAHALSLQNPASGEGRGLAAALTSDLQGFAVSRDGQWIALGGPVEAGPSGWGLRTFRARTGEALAADPDTRGNVLAFSPSGGEIYLQQGAAIEVRRRHDLHLLRRFSLTGRFLGISPSGMMVFAAIGETGWYDPEGFQPFHPVRRIPVTLDAISWSENGQLEVGTGGDGTYFQVWRSDGAELCAPAAPRVADLTAHASSPDGKSVALGRSDGVVEVVAAGGGTPVSIATGRGRLLRVAVSSDGGTVAVLGAADPRSDDSCDDPHPDPGVRPLEVFDVVTGARSSTYVVPRSSCELALSGDGHWLAYSDLDRIQGKLIRVISVDSGQERLRIGPTTIGASYTVHGFSPDGDRLAVGVAEGIALYRIADGAVERVHTDVAPGWLSVVAPSWSNLVSTHREGPHAGKVRVLRMADGTEVASWAGQPGWAHAIADTYVAVSVEPIYSRATGSEIRDIATGQLLRHFNGTAPHLNGPDRLITYEGPNLALWCQ